MSFAYPGLTHCKKCFSLLNMSGRCESCERRKKENEMIKKQIANVKEEAKEYLSENEKG